METNLIIKNSQKKKVLETNTSIGEHYQMLKESQMPSLSLPHQK